MNTPVKNLIDPEINRIRDYLKINFLAEPYKRIVLFSIVISIYHVASNFQGPFIDEIIIFFKISILVLLSLSIGFGIYMLYCFFRKRKVVVDLSVLSEKLKKSRRTSIIRTSPNTLLVKVNILKSYTFCYKSIDQLNEIEDELILKK